MILEKTDGMVGKLMYKGLTTGAGVVWNGPHLSASLGGWLPPVHHTHTWTVHHSHQALITQNTSTDMHVHRETRSQVHTGWKRPDIRALLARFTYEGIKEKNLGVFFRTQKVQWMEEWLVIKLMNAWNMNTERTMRKEACSFWLNMRLSPICCVCTLYACTCMCVCVWAHTCSRDRRSRACWHRRSLTLRRAGWLAFIHWLRQKRALQTPWAETTHDTPKSWPPKKRSRRREDTMMEMQW